MVKLEICCLFLVAFSGFSFAPIAHHHTLGHTILRGRKDGSDEMENQAVEALHSLAEFHEGTWQGRARSFTVTPDVAAGIVARKTSPEYKLSVKLGLDLLRRDYTVTETMEWGEEQIHISSRSLSLTDCSMDVDAVDATYSLDATLPDFPTAISGTEKFTKFMIEHCIATGADERARCLVFYGADGSIIRVVLCDEKRIDKNRNSSLEKGGDPTATITTQDLIEMKGDIDRLVDRIAGKIAPESVENRMSPESDENFSKQAGDFEPDPSLDGVIPFTRHTASLLEVAAGVWLGDAIIRDIPTIPVTAGERGKGFVASAQQKPLKIPFATWSVGVQKVAWRWMWNFGEEIRQVNDAGKAMGAELLESLTRSTGGSVCVNEGLSRRIPPNERMVYIDWDGDDVGFLVGSVSVKVPRYLNFSRRLQGKPLCSEFCVFQREQADNSKHEGDAQVLPDLVCSKVARIYNFEGMLKQGCTAFFKLKRFGTEKDNT